MNLNRSLIKSQAKQLIKGKVLALFLITIVIGLLTGSVSALLSVDKNDFNALPFGNSSSSQSESTPFEDFWNDDEAAPEDGNDFYNFGSDQPAGKIQPVGVQIHKLSDGIRSDFSGVSGIATLFLAPLSITLAGYYLLLIRGRKVDVSDSFNYVFSNTFDKNYWKKFVCSLLQTIILTITFCLFIIPGIIFYYRYYFANMVLADNPNLSATEAIDVSKKMTKGHKGELFALDLSFFGWLILTAMTAGILSIYTLPYYNTTKALYYENFRLRALQCGELNEFDFMSQEEKLAQTEQAPTNNASYYAPVENTAPVNTYYTPVQEQAPVQNVQNTATVQAVPTTPAPTPAKEVEYTPVYSEPIIPVAPKTPVSADAPSEATVPVETAIPQNDSNEYGSGLNNDYFNGGF